MFVTEWGPETNVSSKIVNMNLSERRVTSVKRRECSYMACHARRTVTMLAVEGVGFIY